jgi:hypothetical protein
MKYDLETRGIQTREVLCWRGPAATVNRTPVRLYSPSYQIFWEVVVGLELGPLSLASTIEELLGRKSSGSGLVSREYGYRNPSPWPRGTLCPQKLALTSPTSGSVGIVLSQTQATEFSLISCNFLPSLKVIRSSKINLLYKINFKFNQLTSSLVSEVRNISAAFKATYSLIWVRSCCDVVHNNVTRSKRVTDVLLLKIRYRETWHLCRLRFIIVEQWAA